MVDNETYIGGGQAVKPDQATIDTLVEKLKEKLMAREMIQERIDQLLAKYREMLPKWLTLTHKYITLYPLPTGNANYNRDYDTIYGDNPVFEEVNWSAVDYPEERPNEYRFSRRLSNMYHYKDDPVDYKFPDVNTSIEEEELHWTFNEETGEYEQVPRTMVYKADAAGIIDRYDQSTSFRLATYNHEDDIRTIFFLEIVWGYSGWEWHDYVRTISTNPTTGEDVTETLKGGNLYKLKEITTVHHIIDGHRLYHINDFLNSQDKVTIVEDFNTVHIKAMNRAFKRLTRKYGLNTITPLLLKVYQFPEVIEADDAFCNNKISIIDNHSIELPKLVNVDGFYKWGEFIDGTTFRMNSLESFTNGFYWANFSQTDFNLSNILVGNSLKKVNNLQGLLEMALFYNAAEVSGYDKPVNTFTIDLSGSSLPATTEFNLSRLAYYSGTRYTTGNTASPALQDKIFVFNITLKGLTNLSWAFRKIMNNAKNSSISVDGSSYNHSGPNQIEVNFNNTEYLIRNLDYAFAENTFIELPPKLRNSGGTMINAWANDYTTENYIYYGCSLTKGVTYNFSPSQVLNESQGQFNNCTIRVKDNNEGSEYSLPFTFTNVDALKYVRFQNIGITERVVVDGQQIVRNTGVPFPFVGDFHSSRYQYNEDATDLHRFINFSGSKFTSIRTLANPQTTAQTIYVSGQSAATMFDGCTNIDFSNDNIILDISDTGPKNPTKGTTWTTFRNCSSMIRTPKLVDNHLQYWTSGGDVIRDMFLGCTNLEYVDAEDFTGTWGSSPYSINFSQCPNLRYLKLGNVYGAINLTNCYNVDISTLEATIFRQQTGHKGNDNIFITQMSVWNQLSAAAKAHIENVCHHEEITE